MRLRSITAPPITVLSLQLSVLLRVGQDLPLSLADAPSASPAASSHFSFSRNGNLKGALPFPFPFSSRLRPSRLSRRSQDVLKSGILLLMDSKHHKKFIRKRRIVKVPGRALGRVERREERGGSFVFVYAQYLNKPVLFFTRCSETFLHSTPPLGFEWTREP